MAKVEFAQETSFSMDERTKTASAAGHEKHNDDVTSSGPVPNTASYEMDRDDVTPGPAPNVESKMFTRSGLIAHDAARAAYSHNDAATKAAATLNRR